MARRSVRVTVNVRKSQETRSQTRPLSTFPYVQSAPSVVQAHLRGVRARRRLLRRASAGHNKRININKLNTDRIYIHTRKEYSSSTPTFFAEGPHHRRGDPGRDVGSEQIPGFDERRASERGFNRTGCAAAPE